MKFYKCLYFYYSERLQNSNTFLIARECI
ncbi:MULTISPECIES: hypothetical protein [Bacillus]